MSQKTIEQRPSIQWRFTHEPVLVASVLVGAMLVAVNIFRWTLVDLLTPFIEPSLELGLGCAFLLVFIWSVVYLIRRWKETGRRQAATPLLVNVGMLLIILFVPFPGMTIALNFRWNYKKRMEVVSEVLQGRLGNTRSGSGGSGDPVHLPASYRGLSAGGDDIVVYRRDGQTLILFYDFRGILNSFSGFVYSTGDTKPKRDDFSGDFFEIDHLRPNWYWVSSAN